MISYFSLLTVLITAVHCGDASKCDPDIINRIEAFWASSGPPGGLIYAAVTAYKEVIVATSDKYYPANTKCAYTLFSSGKFTLTLVPNKGQPVSKDVEVTESRGIIIDKVTQVKRYHVYREGGVVATYKCTDTGAKGVAEGAIKVDSKSYSADEIDVSVGLLRYVGVKITKYYPDTC